MRPHNEDSMYIEVSKILKQNGYMLIEEIMEITGYERPQIQQAIFNIKKFNHHVDGKVKRKKVLVVGQRPRIMYTVS